MKNKSILFAVQLPPPIHGSSIMNSLIVQSEKMNSNFNRILLPIQMADSMEDMGLFSFKKILKTFAIIFKLTTQLLFKKIDLFYISLSPLNFAFYKDFILVSIAKLFNKKIIIHLHGQGIKEAAQSNSLKRKMYRHVFKNSEVICLAEALQDDIIEVFKGQPIFLPNGIKKEDHIPYGAKEVSFLFLSNLMKEKGIEDFLEALTKLKNKGYDFNAEIIGSSADFTIDEAKKYLERNNLNDRVKVLGPIYGSEKFVHLAKAETLVLPSYRECYPLTILEAFQAKTAVISTRTGGIPDMISNNKNGFIIEPRDVEALTLKMEVMLKEENLHREMGELNFIKFEQNYTQDIFISKLVEILQNISK